MWIADKEDLNFRGPNNETLLHIAASNGWNDACRALCKAGADIEAQDDDGDTPLHLATFFEQYKTVEILGEYGAKVRPLALVFLFPFVTTTTHSSSSPPPPPPPPPIPQPSSLITISTYTSTSPLTTTTATTTTTTIFRYLRRTAS
jgi:ankyrin repeat protein